MILQTSNSSLLLERKLCGLGLNVASKNAEKRMDFVEFELQRKNLLADISIVHTTPLAVSNLKKFARHPGAAAEDRENKKEAK